PIHAGTHALALTYGQNSGFGSSYLAGVYAGNDGGIAVSTDNGNSWNNSLNDDLGITQFRSVGLEGGSGTHITGGTRNNGTNSFNLAKLPSNLAWFQSLDGDGGDAFIDSLNSSIFFGEMQSDPTQAFNQFRSPSAGVLGSYTGIFKGANDPVQSFAPFIQDPNDSD